MIRWRATIIFAALVFAGMLLFGAAAKWQDQPAPAGDAAAGGEKQAGERDEQGWPSYPLPPPTQFGKDTQHGRGPGFYLNIFKILLVWLLFVVWVKTTDWVSQDCLRVHLNYAIWNTVVFFVFIAAFLLIWIIPLYEVALPLMLVAYLAPLGTFIIVRNKAVQPHQRVMTPDHLRHVYASIASKLGVKVSTEKQAAWQKGPQVNFKATAGAGAMPRAICFWRGVRRGTCQPRN